MRSPSQQQLWYPAALFLAKGSLPALQAARLDDAGDPPERCAMRIGVLRSAARTAVRDLENDDEFRTGPGTVGEQPLAVRRS